MFLLDVSEHKFQLNHRSRSQAGFNKQTFNRELKTWPNMPIKEALLAGNYSPEALHLKPFYEKSNKNYRECNP